MPCKIVQTATPYNTRERGGMRMHQSAWPPSLPRGEAEGPRTRCARDDAR